MTEGSSQGLFVIIAVIIFGIFVAIAYLLFQDHLKIGLSNIFENGISSSTGENKPNDGSIESVFPDKTLQYIIKENMKFKHNENITDFRDLEVLYAVTDDSSDCALIAFCLPKDKIVGLKSLEGVQELTKLQELSIVGTGLQSLQYSEKLGNIKSLVYGSSETEIDLAKIPYLNNLSNLSLTAKKITNIERIKDMPLLYTLGLSSLDIKNLDFLEGNKSIGMLTLKDMAFNNINGITKMVNLNMVFLISSTIENKEEEYKNENGKITVLEYEAY